MVWKFCEIWKSYGKQGPEGPKFCEILSHSVRYGMYERVEEEEATHWNGLKCLSVLSSSSQWKRGIRNPEVQKWEKVINYE